MNPAICICESDANVINPLLQSPDALKGIDKTVLQRLREELARAVIVPDAELAEDVISLNSMVELEDLSEKEVDQYTLVHPSKASIDQGRISVLAPLGAGMLGFKKGDKFKWATPSGEITFLVRKVTRVSLDPKPAATSDSEAAPVA